jgi:protein-tyrosine-phosphatase
MSRELVSSDYIIAVCNQDSIKQLSLRNHQHIYNIQEYSRYIA